MVIYDDFGGCAVWVGDTADTDGYGHTTASRIAACEQPPEDGIVRLEVGAARSVSERAELLEDLDERAEFVARQDDVSGARCRIPAGLVADGIPACATYLAARGMSNEEIGEKLGLGTRTISQYVSDVRSGDR